MRRLSTQATPPAGGSNTKLWTIGGALIGAGAFAAYQFGGASPAAPKVPLKSALDKDNFVEFPLKKVRSQSASRRVPHREIIIQVTPYNHNTAIFHFELPEGTATLLPVASCLVVKSDKLTKDGKPVIRPYTPIGPSEQPGELTLLVKKYDSGNASKFIHEMQVGDKL